MPVYHIPNVAARSGVNPLPTSASCSLSSGSSPGVPCLKTQPNAPSADFGSANRTDSSQLDRAQSVLPPLDNPTHRSAPTWYWSHSRKSQPPNANHHHPCGSWNPASTVAPVYRRWCWCLQSCLAESPRRSHPAPRHNTPPDRPFLHPAISAKSLTFASAHRAVPNLLCPHTQAQKPQGPPDNSAGEQFLPLYRA